MSQILYPYRTIGMVSNEIGLELYEKDEEKLVLTSIGRTYHIYEARKLRLLFVGRPHTHKIRGLGFLQSFVVVTASGRQLQLFCSIEIFIFQGAGTRVTCWWGCFWNDSCMAI